jgi:hypothetical protein
VKNIFIPAMKREIFINNFTWRLSPEFPKPDFEVCNAAAASSDPIANYHSPLACNLDSRPIPPAR